MYKDTKETPKKQTRKWHSSAFQVQKKQRDDGMNAQQATRRRGATQQQDVLPVIAGHQCFPLPVPQPYGPIRRAAFWGLHRFTFISCGAVSADAPSRAPADRAVSFGNGTLRRSLRVVDSEVRVVTFTKVCFFSGRSLNTVVASESGPGLARVRGEIRRARRSHSGSRQRRTRSQKAVVLQHYEEEERKGPASAIGTSRGNEGCAPLANTLKLGTDD